MTGSQLLLGYPQYVWFSLLAEVSYAVFLLVTHKYAARTGCDFHATCDGCVGCTDADLAAIGHRQGDRPAARRSATAAHPGRLAAQRTACRPTASFAAWGSLHPLNLLQLVAPYLFAGRVVGDNTHEFGLYVGAVPLVLAVWVLARRRELGRLAPLAWAALGFRRGWRCCFPLGSTGACTR